MRLQNACLTAIVLVCSGSSAGAAEREFKTLTQAIESRFGARCETVPMMGVASFFARVASINTVRGVAVATFDGLRYSEDKAREFDRVVSEALHDGWVPMVRVRSRKSGEWTGIYTKADGGNLRMMITTLERDEAAIVEVNLSRDQLLGWVRHPDRAGECGSSIAGGCE
jgi:hypothetical protein